MYTAEFTDLKSAITQTLAHGLGRTPLILTTRLVCIVEDTDNTNMEPGQISKLNALFDTDGVPAITIVCDATNFYLSFPNALSPYLLKRDTATVTPKIGTPVVTRLNWNGDVPRIDLVHFKVVVVYL